MTTQPYLLRLVTVVLVVLSLSLTAAYEFAPILSTFTALEGTGSYEAALSVCGERGAYLGAEPNLAVRTTHAELGAATGKATWYAFLGANVNAPANITPVCKSSYMENPYDTASAGDCIYRWKMGRYLEFSDASEAVGSKWFYRSGISFYRGTLVALTMTDCTYTVNGTITMPCGPVNGYSSYFMTATTAPAGTDPSDYIANRPGFDNGHYVVLVGTGSSTVWSDNEPSGGYTYANATKSGTTQTLSPASIAATMPDFIAVCDAQAPSRVMLEPYKDPHSNSNLVWWVIFLVILFVCVAIAFIVIACCQEREDMDEPPEDAPEWAREEARQVTKPKRYVSQSSFRLVPQHDDYDEREMNSYSDVGSAAEGDEDGKPRRKQSEGSMSATSATSAASGDDDSEDGSPQSQGSKPKTIENNWVS